MSEASTILFITPDVPLTPDGFGGASALAYAHLELLAHTPHTLVGVRLSGWSDPREWAQYHQEQEAVWQRIQQWVSCWHEVDDSRGTDAGWWRGHLGSLLDPEAVTRNSIDAATVTALRDIAGQVQPDLIWAEHWRPAAVARYADLGVPVVYSHHDWRWRLATLKGKDGSRMSLRERYRVLRVRRAEEALVRGVAACVSGSAREVAQMQALGVPHVGYFPTTRRPTQTADAPPARPRIVHLGSMQATASRRGLGRFLEVVWDRLRDEFPDAQLWQIGSMDDAPMLQRRIEAAGGTCMGYVQDLTTVLRPYDLHIVPWEHDTGTRTRAPIAFDRRQVVVATHAAMACMPEAQDGINCVLVDRLEDMVPVLHALYEDEGRRKRLGNAARQTFLAAYTREVQQERFNRFLEACMRLSEPGAHLETTAS